MILSRLRERLDKRRKDQINAAVADYLDRLPDDALVRIGSRIAGAAGLTDVQFKRMVEAASGDRVIDIHFGNGDMAIISNRSQVGKSGPGW